MSKKVCVICGKEFDSKGTTKTCSMKCSDQNRSIQSALRTRRWRDKKAQARMNPLVEQLSEAMDSFKRKILDILQGLQQS